MKDTLMVQNVGGPMSAYLNTPTLPDDASRYAELAPVAVIVITFLNDMARYFGKGTSLPAAVKKFTDLFTEFIKQEDCEEHDHSADLDIHSPIWKYRVLAFIPLFDALAHLWRLGAQIYFGSWHGQLDDIISTVSWLYAALRIWMKPPQTVPYLLLIFYLTKVALTAGAFLFASNWQNMHILGWVVAISEAVGSALLAYVGGTFPIDKRLPSAYVASVNETPSKSKTVPEDGLSLWQYSSYSFVEPMIDTAPKKNKLDHEDVWSLSPLFKHKNNFRKHLEYFEENPKHSLLHFLLRSNAKDVILDILSEIYSSVGAYLGFYFMNRLLSSLDSSPADPRSAYVYAFWIFILHLSFAQVDIFQLWHSRRSYLRARGQIMCAIHHKALKRREYFGLDPDAKAKDADALDHSDLGAIVNLLRGDAFTVALRFRQVCILPALVVRLIGSTIFLYRLFGWSAMAALGASAVVYLLNWPLARYDLHLTRRLLRARDARMNGVNNLFQNIRFLKFYGWEGHWAKNVSGNRETELKWRTKQKIIKNVTSFVWTCLPLAMALLSFLFYTVVAGGQLTIAKTFTALALFSNLDSPMREFPGQLYGYLDAYVSIKRLHSFLREDEVPEWATTLRKSPASNRRSDEVGFQNTILRWSIRDAFQLGPLTVEFPRGKLSLVTGATGSGKSAFLGGLLGEMYVQEGQVLISKKEREVAYCAQNPWLEQASIRDNIIFGSREGFVEEKYKLVIEACALQQDFKVMSDGDKTEIGERGVVLSGGTRARVALARALYSEAKVLLLDDPLAAVDMHTARHIVKYCFQGPLAQGRTIVLVTHHISMCLSASNYLVELSSGQILRQGSIVDLQEQGALNSVVQDEDVSEISSKTDDEASHDTSDHIQKKLVQEEYRKEGRVAAHTYFDYIRTSGWFAWTTTFILIAMWRAAVITNSVFLARWSEAYGQSFEQGLTFHSPEIDRSKPIFGLPPPQDNVKPWLLIYFCISTAIALFSLAYLSTSFFASLQASRKYFSKMIRHLIRAPLRFFDTTPIGRILNRFSSDITTIDEDLQSTFNDAMRAALSWCITFAFIVYAIPFFAPFALIIAFLFVRLAPRYVKTARDLRRLESISMSPALSGFDELLKGLSHVRAYAMEERYQDAFYKKLDTFQGYTHVYWLTVGWLQWRYDCLGSVVVFASTICSIWTGTSNALIAVVIVQAGSFVGACRSLVSVGAAAELNTNAVERIEEYLEVEQEAPLVIEDKRPPAYWPSSTGSLEVNNLVVRYAPELPPVLNRLSFTVNSCSKVGIVGRTGSGKSTIALSLLRILELSEGRIILDGVDISTIGLEDLRTKITLISQDVTLLTGTVRDNLDPFGDHTDLECNDVLKRCHLMKGENEGRDVLTLDSAVGASGSFSAGERQLIALARSMLRRSTLVIMDEATSQIDNDLDEKIQRTIREEFNDCMVLTIAHRIKTVLDYDYVMVMGEGGTLLEYDKPSKLLQQTDSAFKSLCKKSSDWNEINRLSNQRA